MAIKKVVIPTKETKYVCELSEEEYNNQTDSSGKFAILNLEQYFTKQETIKPLADDETSANSPIEPSAIYAFINGFNSIEVIFDRCKNSNFGFYSLERTAYTIKTAMEAGYTIYEFSGDNKQAEFFAWGLKMLENKGE